MVLLLAMVFFSYVFILESRLLYSERNFFGVKFVTDTPDGLALVSGTTLHGLQHKDPGQRFMPTLYYSPQGGVGTLLRAYPRSSNNGHLRIGVIGLGVASLASYARSGDFMRFYEIDPAVVGLSIGERPVFSFLRHSAGTSEIVLGDARLSLEHELAVGQPGQFDVLVIDAFNSDSVPLHLLTRESVALYNLHLRGPDSVLAFNISNNFLDLAPVLRGDAEVHHLAIAEVDRDQSKWMLLSANPQMLRLPGLLEAARPPAANRPALVWTDDYSNVFQVLYRVHP